MRGGYHGAMLPLILLEMHDASFAVLGGYDAACLCAVCAGVCAAVSVTSPSVDEAAACRAALRINLAAGDYVEACYPYMARSPAVNAAAYAGAAMAGAVLLEAGGPRGTAYLPLPLVVLLSDRPAALARAVGVAFAVPFFGTLLAHLHPGSPRTRGPRA